MKKIGLGKKLVSIVSAGVLASAFMAPAAFAANTNDTSDATTGNIPTAEGHGTANSASPTADTSIYLIDVDTSTNQTFSVTAPLKIFLAYKGGDHSEKNDTSKDYTLLTPSKDVVTLQNVGAGQPVVTKWDVSNTTTAMSKKTYTEGLKEGGTAPKSDSFYLAAIADSNPGTAYDIGVASDAEDVDTRYDGSAWKLPLSSNSQSYIALDLEGHIYDPTNTRYEESNKIQVVTWTFGFPDATPAP